jgi:hypothetical protein
MIRRETVGLVLAVVASCSGPGDPRSDVQQTALTWGGERRLVAGDAAELDEFGRSVSLVAGRALVGAYGESGARGAAYVFGQSGDNSWTEQQKLGASDGADLDKFGYAVSTAGDRVLVGAYGESAARGAAYLFVQSGGRWIEEHKLVASDGAANDNFGCAVSLTADRALVGASGSDDGRGAAYVFARSGGAWIEEQKLIASDGSGSDSFGYSVALSGARAVVGAPGHDGYRGAAHVFFRNDVWTEEQALVASDGAAFDNFGAAVALDGDVALVGAYWNADFDGAAYVYARTGGAFERPWIETQKLTGSDEGERFGGSLSLSANRALIGALGSGVAYVFARTGDAWLQEQRLVPDGVRTEDFFGWSVALAGDRALVGASYTDQLRGAAYVYALGVESGDAGAADGGQDADPIDAGDAQPGACDRGDECASGHCEDGICCDRTCMASESCRAALKVSGEDGVCGPARAAALGAACRFDVQCTTGHCRGSGAGGVCTEAVPALDAGCAPGDVCKLDAAGFAPSSDVGCGCRVVSPAGDDRCAWLGLTLVLLGLRHAPRPRRDSRSAPRGAATVVPRIGEGRQRRRARPPGGR